MADVPAFPVCTVTCLVLQRGYSFALCSSRFALIPVCKLKDKTVFWIAAILLLQPYEWGRAIYAMINPEYVPATGHFIPYYKLAQEVTSNGSFFEVLPFQYH